MDVFQAAVLASALALDQDFLLIEAIGKMDGKLRSKVKAGTRRALTLLKGGPAEAVCLLEPLV